MYSLSLSLSLSHTHTLSLLLFLSLSLSLFDRLVGEWTWGWMEPMLGTLSFILLAFQFSRSQMRRMAWFVTSWAALSVAVFVIAFKLGS